MILFLRITIALAAVTLSVSAYRAAALGLDDLALLFTVLACVCWFFLLTPLAAMQGGRGR